MRMQAHATDSPVVSVIITLYNKEPFIEEAIRSALSSTFSGIEVLVVDDGSTDGGPEVVSRIQDVRIRFIASTGNTGRAAAANRGIDAARGEFLAILDADDVMEPERIVKQLEFMRANPSVVACGSAALIIGRGQHVARWPERDAACKARLLFEDPMLYGACMLRRDVLMKHAVRCEEAWRTPGMDYILQASLAPFGEFANLSEPLTRYRIHEGNFRHDRDSVQDKLLLQHRVFEKVGLAASESELRDHLMVHRMFLSAPDAQAVKRLRRWMKRLVAWNDERAVAPREAFLRTARAYWDHLFYVLPDHDRFAALIHVVSWWPFRCSHLVYLVKHILRKPLRKPESL